MLGGNNLGGNFSDEWYFDGDKWRTAIVGADLAAMSGHAATYDERYARIVTMGGTADPQTWFIAQRRLDALPDRCTSVTDSDGDGLGGCDDPDCWGRCTPSCPPSTTRVDMATSSTLAWPVACAVRGARYCGDGSCNQPLEDRALCPADCP